MKQISTTLAGKKGIAIILATIMLLLCTLAGFKLGSFGNASITFSSILTPITNINGISASWISQTGIVYAGVSGHNVSIYSSSDGGVTWSAPMLNIPDASGFRSIFVNARGYIFASPSLSTSYSGIWRSIDNGATWAKVLALNASQRVWGIDADINGNLFAGLYGGADAIIWKSSDDGVTWKISYNDSNAAHIHQICVDRSTGYIYASVGDNTTPSYIKYVIRSTDDGLTWSKILAGMPQVAGIAIGNGFRVFGSDTWGMNATIYRTTDDISYTTVFQFSGNVQNFWMRSDTPTTVFASFVAGALLKAEILISTDGGLTWQDFKDLDGSVQYAGSQYCSNFVNGVAYFSNNNGSPHTYKISPAENTRITFMPFNFTFTVTTSAYTIPTQITIWGKTWNFQQWQDGDTNTTKTMTGDISVYYN